MIGGATARKSSASPPPRSSPAAAAPAAGGRGGLLLGQAAADLLVEHREVLDLGDDLVGRVDRAHPVDQHVDRPAGRGQLLQLARDQHSGSVRTSQAVALVDCGGTIRLIVPNSSSSSRNTMPLAVPGRWRATTSPPIRTAPAVLEPLQVARW